MGVLRGRPEPTLMRLENHLQDYMPESPNNSATEGDDSEVENVCGVQSAPVTPRRKPKRPEKQRRFCNKVDLETGGHAAKRHMGVRKRRRLENFRLLAALVDEDDICEDLSDLLPDSISAFTELFLEKEKMEMWNEFIEKSEEEQTIYLNTVENSAPSCSGTSNGYVLGPNRSAKMNGPVFRNDEKPDQRSGHPAFSAEACFARIETRFRQMLKPGKVPMGKLEHFEKELVDYFNTSPDGVWVNVLRCGYDRLLLHAVAQYLSLKSRSFDNPVAGQRETEVENRKPYFIPPRSSLTSYLEQMSRKS